MGLQSQESLINKTTIGQLTQQAQAKLQALQERRGSCTQEQLQEM